MSTAVLNTAYLQFGTERDMVVAVETQFFLQGQGEEVRGFFLLLPDAASLQVILRAVRVQ
jgi:chemotaxis protein CheC